MKGESVIHGRWEDIVFENRNKDYGAYLNRRKYPGHVALSAFFAVSIIGLIFAYPSIHDYFIPVPEVISMGEIKQITVNLDQPPPIIPNEPPPAKLDVVPPVKTVFKFLPPKITDKQVVEEEIPTVEEMKQYQPTSPEPTTGAAEEVVVFREPVKEVVEETEKKEEEEVNKIFLVVEQPPEYEGGLQALYKYIFNNTKYPAQASRLRIEGSVFISFVVDKEGKITEVEVVKGIGAGCDEEAIRVIQAMPRWKPGKQRGKPVKVRYVLPVKFKLLD